MELARPFRFMDIRMNREQMIAFVVATLAMGIMYVLLTRMPIGRAMRAVADTVARAGGASTARRSSAGPGSSPDVLAVGGC